MQVRKAAIESLADILVRQRKAEQAMERYGVRLDARGRGLLHELVYGVLRRFYSLEADYSRFCRSKPDDTARMALLIGTYQLRYMRVPAHAALSETVAAVMQSNPKAGGFVNAVLRRVSEHEPPQKLKPNQRAELPRWIYAGWRDAFGAEQVTACSEALKTVPQLSLALFTDRDKWLEQVTGMGIDAVAGELTPCAVLLPAGTDVTTLPGYEEGAFTVIDQAAQAAVMALEPVCRNGVILDICAAPGGKTAMLSHRFPEATILAIELNARRIPRLNENLQRLGCSNVQVIQADGLNLPLPSLSVDALLLDAPCSASGILRRHPDAKFLHDEQAVETLAALQRRLLSESLRVLKPDAAMVYAVCSIHPQENEQVLAESGALWDMQRRFPDIACDGFFHAVRCRDGA
ncbi:transcription antitermination factor NusB [Mariprofundus ferrooxydans]|uniref:Sun protein n=1 Tax=Mariprofundus ferrooxydans PV-1 TaxID=314345 RepID=Q0F395_9PROT|nr:transcription antitermination factor NusB [Mariprofundus ferrooxydans]EAU56046.1 Sun protein [Mariprofundus ferrooxydans PV-1]KON46633.1 Sun protein [Mariprofundus ferrooxydans]